MSFRRYTIPLLAVGLFILAGSASAFFGLRAGIGQFVPEDSTFKESYANAYSFDVRYHISEPLFVSGAAKFYNVHAATVPIAMVGDPGPDIEIGAYKHRLDAVMASAGIGIGKLLGKGGIGFYPYACLTAGVISPVVSQQVEYYACGDTIGTLYAPERERRWAVLANPYAGLEIRFLGIGVFAQADYIYGNNVTYDPVKMEGVEIFPGGELAPSGWAVYVGIVLD